MFAKNTPPSGRRNNVTNVTNAPASVNSDGRIRTRKGVVSQQVKEGKNLQVRNPTKNQPYVAVRDVSPNTTLQSDISGQEPGPKATNAKGEEDGKETLENAGDQSKTDDADADANVREQQTEGAPIGKLSDTMYRPLGTRSRSSSPLHADLDRETDVICKGGPNGSCGNEVTDSDEAMQCDLCNKWYHCSCQDVPQPTYQIAGKHDALMWLCKDCKDAIHCKKHQSQGMRDEIASLKASIHRLTRVHAEQLGTIQDMLKNQQTEVQKQHPNLESLLEEKLLTMQKALEAQKKSLDEAKAEHLQLTNQVKEGEVRLFKLMEDQGKLLQSAMQESETRHKSYASVVKDECKEVLTTISSKMEILPIRGQTSCDKPLSNPNEQFTGIFDAFVDREKRKCNVVVHNLTESDGDTHNERMTQDRLRLKELLRKELHMNFHFTKSFRVGKFTEGKSRLLVATLDTEEAKWEVIRIAPQLRGTTMGSNIYINPDLTKQEREEGKRLRSELAERRNKGEHNLVIRKGRIVQRQQTRDGRPERTVEPSEGAPRNPSRATNQEDRTSHNAVDGGLSRDGDPSPPPTVQVRAPALASVAARDGDQHAEGSGGQSTSPPGEQGGSSSAAGGNAPEQPTTNHHGSRNTTEQTQPAQTD